MDSLKKLEQELSDVLDKYDQGLVDYMDVTMAMLNLCGLGNPELGERARVALEKYIEKKQPGKPKIITQEQISRIFELKKNGMTQEKIAQMVGISLSSVRRELKKSEK